MSTARPAAKPRFSFDIADDGDGATQDGDNPHGTTAHGHKTNSSMRPQRASTPQPVSLPTAAPAFKFDIDDDDKDDEFDLGRSTAQRDDCIASNQHASTSASALTAAATAIPVAKPGSAVSTQRPLVPKMLATSHAHSGKQSAAPSAPELQPAWQSASGGASHKSLPAVPAVATAQQPVPKSAPSSFKPPRRITASAGAEAVDREADKEGEAGSHVGRAGPKQPLLRLRRAGQAAPHAVAHAAPRAVPRAVPHAVSRAVPHAAHKVQGDNRDDGECGIAPDLLALLI